MSATGTVTSVEAPVFVTVIVNTTLLPAHAGPLAGVVRVFVKV